MSKINKFLIPLLLFLIGFLTRFSVILKDCYHIDCLDLSQKSVHLLDTGELLQLYGSGYPLTTILGAFFIFIGRFLNIQDPVLSINFMSVFFGSISIPFFYILIKRFTQNLTAIFSSLLLIFSPIHLGLSVYGKNHTISLFFLIISVNFLCTYLKYFKLNNLYLSAIFLGLMGATRLQDMILIIPSIILLFFYSPLKKFNNTDSNQSKIINIIKYTFITSILILIFHIPFVFSKNISSYTSQMNQFWQAGLTNNFRGLFSSHLILSLKYILLNQTWMGIAIFVLGCLITFKENRKLLFFLILWIAVPLFFYGNLYSTVPRFFTLILPPIYLIQGILFNRLWRIKSFFRYICLTFFMIIIFLSFSFIYPKLLFRHNAPSIKNYGVWFSKKTPPNAIIISSEERHFIEYYGKRKTWSKPVNFFYLSDADLAKFKINLDKLLNQKINPVYITSEGIFSYDYENKFSNLIKNNYRLDYIDWTWYDDWHRGELTQNITLVKLYRLNFK